MGKSRSAPDDVYTDDYDTSYREEYMGNKYYTGTEGDDLADTEQTLEHEHVMNTAILLRSRLIQYAEDNSYPLCEFLDLENVYNFIQWILVNGQR